MKILMVIVLLVKGLDCDSGEARFDSGRSPHLLVPPDAGGALLKRSLRFRLPPRRLDAL